MSVLVISGISGAGKSVALHTLEDVGYYCIDNLPPALLGAVSKLNVNNKLAVTIDSRSLDKYETVLVEMENLKKEGIEIHSLFLYCEKDIILKRYKQTRRKHPLLSEETPTLEMAIEKEFDLCQSVMEEFDVVIDTSYTNNSKLRQLIIDTYTQNDYKGIIIKLISFGYKNGLPSEADLVYDVRCMPNPFYIEKLRNHTGLEDCVFDYVFSFEQANTFASMMSEFIKKSLPYYIEEGKNELVIGIGCTSGHHRSVSFVRKLTEDLKELNQRIIVIHRDIEKDF